MSSAVPSEGRRSGGRRRSSGLACGLCSALLLSGFGACKTYNRELLEEQRDSAVTGVAGNGAGDGGPADGAAPPSDGGGTAGKGSMGMAGADAPLPGCFLNVDPITRATCPQLCPETCNAVDDDCDGQVDEIDMDAPCALEHAESACIEGRCLIVQCDDDYRDCDDDPSTGCEAAHDDVNNCGTCGRVCALANAIPACVDGKCMAAGCEALFADCDVEPNDCETRVNTLDMCGDCGVTCSEVPNATPDCGAGVCGVGVCVENFGDCNEAPGDGCEQALDTLEHCGGCNTDCALPGSHADCATSVCLAVGCEDGFADCDSDPKDGCESLHSERDCGSCGATCDTSLTNVESAACGEDGTCTLTCAKRYDDCDGNPQTGCETEVTLQERCGSCDGKCEIENAIVSCETGDCEFVRCADGFGDCNDELDDGCETPLDQVGTCGSCDISCGVGAPACRGRVCTDTICSDANTADCDENGSCETNLRTSVANCGGCGAECEFTVAEPNAQNSPVCTDGRCQPVCDTLFGNCNNDYRDGCERSLRQLGNCGSCGTPCAIANATETCATGQCRVDDCAPDWADCNEDGTSCETQLGTLANCTGCGSACALPNAVPTCAGTAGNHSCAISACQPNFADCDTTASNGCEIDKRTSARNCGSCGNDCTEHAHVQSATCGNNLCNYTCASNFGNCTGAPGCETPLTTLTDCGACGITCSRQNGVASCSTGSCRLMDCNDGYANCDNNDANGCEPLDTLQNCGECGQACLPANGMGRCDGGSCEIDRCSDGWADCDGDPDNGCERNTRPPADGGLGPCLPDPSCARFAYDDRDFYFCTADLNWATARARCQLQRLGELVHINDASEGAFVRSHVMTNAWIGGQDMATEGRWIWSNDDTRFWMGGASGTSSAYANWGAGEPNNTGNNEDCAEIRTDGSWNDENCASLRDFVCEVQADLCPDDPDKINPGQCGCGEVETDSDSDGTADCNDDCPDDPNKIEPGACDCGTADTDSDMDDTPDCDDGCANDPGKTEPGQCGCGMADTDTDNDGMANCIDACPFDSGDPPCSFDFTPSNFDPKPINFIAAPSATLNCGTTTIDTSGSVTIGNWCPGMTAPTPIVRPQPNGGSDVVIVPLSGLTVASGATLRVTGTRPVILAVRGDVRVAGAINARGQGTSTGAGGNQQCPSNAVGGTGRNSAGLGNNGGGGGGGGAFGANGGLGGNGSLGGATGIAHGSDVLTPLRGGCAGGRGGNGNGTGGQGGVAGGAVQLTVSGTLVIATGGIVSASGGAGQAGSTTQDGGGGGGSGGGVLLEAGTLNVEAGAWVTANGGGAASGSAGRTDNATAGTDGWPDRLTRAAGGPGRNGGGSGGGGGAQEGGAQNGANGQQECSLLLLCYGGGGGGGGGSAGRVRLRGAAACTIAADRVSPATTPACP